MGGIQIFYETTANIRLKYFYFFHFYINLTILIFQKMWNAIFSKKKKCWQTFMTLSLLLFSEAVVEP